MKVLNNIEFEGKLIKPSKAGFYKCPFNCGNPSYPKQKWKTEKGIMSHLNKCPNRPSLLKQKEIDKQLKIYEFERLKTEYLKTFKYKIGDQITYVRRIIVKDTHEKRFNRMVRVRYEPILRFSAEKATIKSINFNIPYKPTLENLNECVFFNSDTQLSDLTNTYDDAIIISKEKTIANEKYRNECSSYR